MEELEAAVEYPLGHHSPAPRRTIDTHQTFFKLVGEKNLDKEFIEKIKLWQWEKWSLCDVHLALKQAPRFTAAAPDPGVHQAFIYLLGCENLASLKKHWDAMEEGDAADAGFNCCFPSVHDPFQAPPGRRGPYFADGTLRLKDGGHEKWLNREFDE